MEATEYSGNIVNTGYQYDNQDRISGITYKKNDEPPVSIVSVAYTGNEVVLVSFPNSDPSYNQTSEVRLTLDGSGRIQKRIQSVHVSSKSPNGSQEYRYDTTFYEYEAGLLKKTIENRRDSIWIQSNTTIKRQFNSTVNYTNSGGNLISKDEFVTYPITTTQNGVSTISGGSSQYHTDFSYTKGFPNLTDYKNAAVLAEYPLFSYDPPLNPNYKNMPDQIAVINKDWDINGNIIFNITGTINVGRTYDTKGFLSAITIPPGSTQDTKISFYYGKR